MGQAETHQKNISTTLIAVPASKAADKTSSHTQKSALATQSNVKHKHTVVFSPEGEMSSPDQVLEHKPNHSPWDVVQTRCRWDEVDTTKQDAEGKRHRSVWISSIELGPLYFSGPCTKLTGNWTKERRYTVRLHTRGHMSDKRT